jgi:hypothetical protein
MSEKPSGQAIRSIQIGLLPIQFAEDRALLARKKLRSVFKRFPPIDEAFPWFPEYIQLCHTGIDPGHRHIMAPGHKTILTKSSSCGW